MPVDKVDPTYAGIRDIGDLPVIERERIEAFFRVYKDLPAGRKDVVLNGFGDAAEARVLIQAALERFSHARNAALNDSDADPDKAADADRSGAERNHGNCAHQTKV